MTRPAYDPLRPPAPPFPGYRLRAAGLSDEAIAPVAAHYASLDYDGRVRFVRDVTRVPNEELARRYADGTDAGPSPALLSPEELADAHKADELKRAAASAGLPTSGTKVDVATRLVEAGKTDTLPPVAPEPPAIPPAPPIPSAPDATSAPQTAPAATPGPDSPAAPADAAPAASAPATAPVATTDTTSAPEAPANTPATPDTPAAAAVASTGTSAAPTTPAAPADGTPTPDGGTPA